MPTCRHCRKTYELDADLRAGGVCPHCRAEIDLNASPQTPQASGTLEPLPDETPTGQSPTGESPAGDWMTIARSTSVAEIGYLANVLDGPGIESRIEQHDSFNAVDGGWTALFQLQVASEEAVVAAEAIQNRLARDASSLDDKLPESELPRPNVGDEANAPVIWRPLLLIVIAGAALIFLGQHIRGFRGPGPNQGQSDQTDLLRALEQTRQPFISQPYPDNRQRHRLWYDQRQRAWRLDTDTDGDGEYERKRLYR